MATTKVKQINREQYEALVALGAIAKASYSSTPLFHSSEKQKHTIAWIRNYYDKDVRTPRNGEYYYTLVEADDD